LLKRKKAVSDAEKKAEKRSRKIISKNFMNNIVIKAILYL